MFEIAGMKVIRSEFAKVEFTKVVGVADSRRPNTRRPLYRMVKRHKYPIYMIGGRNGTVVFHPSVEEKVRSAMLESVKEMERGLFGFSTATQTAAQAAEDSAISLKNLQKIIADLPKPEPSFIESFMNRRPLEILPPEIDLSEDLIMRMRLKYRWW